MPVIELMKETYLKWRVPRLTHMATLLAYVVLLVPFEGGEVPPFGGFIVLFSGVLMPVILSTGIFGEDISSGRMRAILTTPVTPLSLYVCRALGIACQCCLSVLLACAIVSFVHGTLGYANPDRLLLWAVSAALLALCWAALSSSISVFAPRSGNTAIVLLICAGAMVIMLHPVYTQRGSDLATKFAALQDGVNRVLPPVVPMVKECFGTSSGHPLWWWWVHTAILAAAYGVIGIVGLLFREYKPQNPQA